MGTIVDRNYKKTEVVFGNAPAGTPEETKNACSNINWVRNDINEIKSQFIKLGFHLEEISRCEIYKVFGFEDFYEFCEANFHLSRSTVSRHVNLFLRFCCRNGKYETPTMFIDERWKDYSYSQLCEMLPLPDRKLCDIKPEMTIAQIREYKKSLKEKDTSVDFASLDKLIDRAQESDQKSEIEAGEVEPVDFELIVRYRSYCLKKCIFDIEELADQYGAYIENDILELRDDILSVIVDIEGHYAYALCIDCVDAVITAVDLVKGICGEAKAQREPETIVCDVAQTEPLPEPETCEDDVEDFIYEKIKRRRQEIMQNVYDLKNFIDRKDYSMASVSGDVLCGRLKSLFGV